MFEKSEPLRIANTLLDLHQTGPVYAWVPDYYKKMAAYFEVLDQSAALRNILAVKASPALKAQLPKANGQSKNQQKDHDNTLSLLCSAFRDPVVDIAGSIKTAVSKEDIVTLLIDLERLAITGNQTNMNYSNLLEFSKDNEAVHRIIVQQDDLFKGLPGLIEQVGEQLRESEHINLYMRHLAARNGPTSWAWEGLSGFSGTLPNLKPYLKTRAQMRAKPLEPQIP